MRGPLVALADDAPFLTRNETKRRHSFARISVCKINVRIHHGKAAAGGGATDDCHAMPAALESIVCLLKEPPINKVRLNNAIALRLFSITFAFNGVEG